MQQNPLSSKKKHNKKILRNLSGMMFSLTKTHPKTQKLSFNKYSDTKIDRQLSRQKLIRLALSKIAPPPPHPAETQNHKIYFSFKKTFN